MGYTVVDLEGLEGEGPGGMVRKVRRALGARAFGLNYFVFPPGVEGRPHDHAADGHEEVYFVVRAAGQMRLGDEEAELRPGHFLRVDADTERVPASGEDGLEVLTVGAPLDGRYEPPD
jgi:uncharacterized cupin superfamily protein